MNPKDFGKRLKISLEKLPLISVLFFAHNKIVRDRKSMSDGKLNNLWVLFVDDEADARTMVSFMLQINGARVTTANSSVEALEILKNGEGNRSTPNIIISDIGMPNESGYALIEKIRALPDSYVSSIPAIALTGFNRPEDKENALEAGFQMHIGKPFEMEFLVEAIADLAKRKTI